MTIIAGSFPHQVQIQRNTSPQTGWNPPQPSVWESLTAKPIWANVKYLSGSESIKADASVSVVRASVRIRWRAGITAGMRVVHGADTLDIEAVLPGTGRQHVDLVCKRVT